MKAYWVCIYEKIENLEKLKEYAAKRSSRVNGRPTLFEAPMIVVSSP